MRPSKILIVSRSRSTAEALEQHLSERREFQPAIRVIANGHADPLQGIDSLPDILLLHSTSGQIELQFLAENGVNGNLPLICCGPADDTEAMRLAMRAGAKDYLPEPIASGDLIACIERIRSETLRANGPAKGKLIAITNGKGGSGASFLSTSLAHSLAIEEDQNVVLADMDLQFGGLFRYLDLNPKMGIVEALDAVTEIDDISADAYTCEHPSGLRLLSAANTGARLPRAISIERLESLLDVYLSMSDYVVADTPARLDGVTEMCFERADQIIVVVQQFLPNVQDAARLLQLLSQELGVDRKRVIVAVNRYSKTAEIELSDIVKALSVERLITIPNQFKLASESINSGIPVGELSRNAALTKSIRKLHSIISNTRQPVQPSLLKRAMPGFLRS